MLFDEAVKLLPPGTKLRLSSEWLPGQPVHKYEAVLEIDGVAVGGVTSDGSEDVFLAAVKQMICSRFDASYDECEWRPR